MKLEILYLGCLTYVNFDGKSGCGTKFLASASNSVQIYPIMADLWQKFDFQYGGLRHLGFCGISILPVKPVVGPHFLSLCQTWCESVQEWPRYCRLTDLKIASAAILNLHPVTIFVIRSSLGCFWPQTLSFVIETPKTHILGRIRVVKVRPPAFAVGDDKKKQESWAIAKMTARCALCMVVLKIFGSPWLRSRQLFPKLGLLFRVSI